MGQLYAYRIFPSKHRSDRTQDHQQKWYARTDLRVVYGNEAEVRELLGASTGHVECTHLTSRHFDSRLVRKTLGYSKSVELHRAMTVWEHIIYNLVRPLKTLRQEVRDDPRRRWLPRTPAMASGLTDHICSWLIYRKCAGA